MNSKVACLACNDFAKGFYTTHFMDHAFLEKDVPALPGTMFSLECTHGYTASAVQTGD